MITRLFERVRSFQSSPLVGLTLLLSPVAASADVAAVLKHGNELLANEQAVKAYHLLADESEQYIGEPDFDYLLGVAALKAGYPGQAVFALERVVQQQPEHAAARMELVAAYLQLGLDQQAEEQLRILDTQNPPKAAREAIARYRDVLKPRLSGTPDPVRFIGLSYGYDNNVGSYPEMELGNLGLQVDPVESGYSLLRGTMWEPVRLDDKRRIDLTLHGQMRNYRDADAEQFDLGLLHFGILLDTTVDASNTYGVGLQGNKLWLDSDSFRNHFGINALWKRRLGAELSGQLGLKINNYRFTSDRYDYNQYVLSAEMQKNWSPRLKTSLLADVETEKADESRLGGDASGLTLGAAVDYRLNQRHQLGGELRWQYTSYDEKYQPGLYNPTSSDKERTDKSYDLSATWRYAPARDWEVGTEVTYRKKDSSVRFYEIDRWTAQVGVLRYF